MTLLVLSNIVALYAKKKTMKLFYSLIITTLFYVSGFSQVKNSYSISFNNIAHHEAQVTAKFDNLQQGDVNLTIAKKSPGSYGEYQFVQNIYNLKITDGSGKNLDYTQYNLNEWKVKKHKGEINVSYSIFGNTKDGIFSEFSEDQVILNNPSVFIYIPKLESRPVQLNIEKPYNLNWKTATQLKKINETTYEADNLHDFMDSPVYLANFSSAEKTIETNGKSFNLKIALYGNENYADELLEKVSKTIEEQYKVFGSYPNFSNNTYQFILSYQPNNENSMIEHKSSSLLISNETVSKTTPVKVIESMATLFAKTWNKTRIIPISLKPFNLQENVLTREYWFADGFSNYYALLSMVRAGIITEDKFLEKTSYIVNSVIKSSALKYNNALEMSKYSIFYAGNNHNQTALNATNLYIPYNNHGFVIALLLDLDLRDRDNLNLDEFMSLMWSKYGKTGNGYNHENIYGTLKEYAGDSFAESFFKKNIIENSGFEFQKPLENMGVTVSFVELPYLGAEIEFNDKDLAEITNYTIPGSPAYVDGLEKGDIIISLNSKSFSNLSQLKNAISQNKIGKKIAVKYSRNGVEKNTEVRLAINPHTIFSSNLNVSSKVADKKRSWIGE